MNFSIAISVLLLATIMHSIWNVYAKRASNGFVFVWFIGTVTTILYAPFVIAVLCTTSFSFNLYQIGLLLLSGFLHFAYTLFLLYCYEKVDMTVAYPIIRGMVPVLAGCAGLLFLNENIGNVGLCGVVAIITGVWLVGSTSDNKYTLEPILWGLGTAFFAAAYSLCDKIAVTDGGINPIVLDYAGAVMRCVILMPFVFRKPKTVSKAWEEHRTSIFVVGILMPLSFILVLYALKTLPLTVVVPIRELSVLWGIVIAGALLGEKKILIRLKYALLIPIGVILIIMG
ncbi:MAG: EamA family transporter [Desulfobacterales bacterium]|nr:EamA family transporter [Desulfobacterales bacterium]